MLRSPQGADGKIVQDALHLGALREGQVELASNGFQVFLLEDVIPQKNPDRFLPTVMRFAHGDPLSKLVSPVLGHNA